MDFKVSFRKRPFRLIIAIAVGACLSPSLVLAGTDTIDDDSGDKTINSGTTENDKQKLDDNNRTLTNSGTIEYNANSAVQTSFNKSGITIINNAGGIIANTGAAGKDYAIKGQQQTNLTITNSGTIEASQNYIIDIQKGTGTTITNNAGGIIRGGKNAIYGYDSTTTDTTVTNSGKIYSTAGNMAMDFSNATGTIITNNSGGEIYRDTTATGNNAAITIGADSSITNSGQIRNELSNAEKSISSMATTPR